MAPDSWDDQETKQDRPRWGMDAEGKEQALFCPPTKDLELTALSIGARRVGCQAEVVASILGKDWLDPQGTLGQNLQPGTEGGLPWRPVHH